MGGYVIHPRMTDTRAEGEEEKNRLNSLSSEGGRLDRVTRLAISFSVTPAATAAGGERQGTVFLSATRLGA